MTRKIHNRLSQTQFIVLGFLLIITTGTLLLMLPFSTKSGNTTTFLDALFTSVSATCVTGLVVADTFTHWTTFGQIIILIMIQLGGLGFITIGVFFSLILRRKIGLKTRGLLQESVNTLEIGGIIRLTKRILMGTLMFEGIGAIILAIRFSFDFGILKGIYFGIFHAVSAFCNAGFDLMGGNEKYSSLVSYVGDPVVNLTIMLLIIIGGIGFIVWDDLAKNKLHFKKYMFHTKIVLVTTIALIFVSAGLFFVIEYGRSFADLSLNEKIWGSLFSSVTARTAGFNTTDTGALCESSKLLTMCLMFIGGGPGSTAGGIKTTTFFVMTIYLWSCIKGKNSTHIFGRRFDDDAIRKASSVFCLNLFLVVIASFIIMAYQNINFSDVMFETFSAMGTVGMTTGITRDLCKISRVIIIILMFAGRIGSLSFALSFMSKKNSAHVELPKEKITVG